MILQEPPKPRAEGKAGVAYWFQPGQLAQLILPPGGKIPADWLGMLGMCFIRLDGKPKTREWWWMSVVHLRHIEGAPVRKEEGATHELLIASIDPECHVAGLIGLEPRGIIHPPGLVIGSSKTTIQFGCESDELARKILAVSVKCTVDGHCTLDDFERGWRAMIDAVIPKLHEQAQQSRLN